jgi:hypothetical protein
MVARNFKINDMILIKILSIYGYSTIYALKIGYNNYPNSRSPPYAESCNFNGPVHTHFKFNTEPLISKNNMQGIPSQIIIFSKKTAQSCRAFRYKNRHRQGCLYTTRI